LTLCITYILKFETITISSIYLWCIPKKELYLLTINHWSWNHMIYYDTYKPCMIIFTLISRTVILTFIWFIFWYVCWTFYDGLFYDVHTILIRKLKRIERTWKEDKKIRKYCVVVPHIEFFEPCCRLYPNARKGRIIYSGFKNFER